MKGVIRKMLTVSFRKSRIEGVSSVVHDVENGVLTISGGASKFKFEGIHSVQAIIRGCVDEVVGCKVTMPSKGCINSRIKAKHLNCIIPKSEIEGAELEGVECDKLDSHKLYEDDIDEVIEIESLYSSEGNDVFKVVLPKSQVFVDGIIWNRCTAEEITIRSSLKFLKVQSRLISAERVSFVDETSVINNTDFYIPLGRGFEHIVDEKGELNRDGTLPMYETLGAAAADFRSSEEVVIPPVEVVDGKVVAKPTLVHTGIKAYMEENEVLHLYNRSSNPKRGLVLANGVGVVDRDYYNNKSNNGDIMFAFYNFSGEDVKIEKGQAIGQGEFVSFLRPNDDCVKDVKREGGFGSTGK